jgi:putative serine protease PepD
MSSDLRSPWLREQPVLPPFTGLNPDPKPQSGKRLVVIALLVGLLGGVLGSVGGDLLSTQRGTSTNVVLPTFSSTGDAESSVAAIAKAVLPTVVSLQVSGSRDATGSGFVIDASGYILTNNHVIASAANGGSVKVFFQDGSSYDGKIVGRNPGFDLAVIKVNATNLPTLPLGDSDKVTVGEPVIAVGSPLGLSGTVTSGIVSAFDRPVTAGGSGDTSFINAIQTDAAINPGNSGGPLVNGAGFAIGVNSAIATLGGSTTGSIGLGFAIPINAARRIAQEIIQTGTSSTPILGVLVDLNYNGPGARLTNVTADGPAEQAGLEPGDLVLAINGRSINGSTELVVAIRSYAPGERIELTIQKSNGTQRTVSATLSRQVD